MRRGAIAAATLALAAPAVSMAQSQAANIVGTAAGLIGGMIANGKLQRDIASMSSPLQYQTDVPALDPNDPHDPRKFDISGVRIGMTPDKVIQTLRASRYTVTSKVMHGSFDSEVRNQVSMGGPTPVRAFEVPFRIVFSGPDSQEIAVGFIALPDGPVVQSITYSMTGDAMAPEAFAAQIQQKYGDPAQGDGDVLLWCVGRGRPCDGDWNHRPHMRVDLHAKNIDLQDADDARDAALQARIDAEVAARKRTVANAQF